jgi:alpha/beta superfamily hydrolase|tara:strand:- start:1198 stop:1428 length:231 start_codon:yes stop_codon:yes gene_type:complete
MILPKFILGDNTNFPEAIFVIHTEFPRFIINLQNDEVEWLEEFDKEDQKELEDETETAIEEASKFYDNEVAQYKND